MCKPHLLLHVCCASCATSVVEKLNPNFYLGLFFYNPNIYPLEEYERRQRDFEKLGKALGVPAFTGNYDSDRWLLVVRGLESEPEGGRRCAACFRVRLEATAHTAMEKDCTYYATTLSVSPHKDVLCINRIGEDLKDKYPIRFLAEDFKKGDGFRRSCELSREAGFYRQDYCGCVYSKRAREAS